jgi:peptidoglycan L-alanyl-D-glutamate endopeptidase CwlK
MEEQIEFVAQGKSKTLKSRHIGGFAIDYVALVNRRVSYDVGHMEAIADCFKLAAAQLGVPIGWGGDWVSFKDTPHIQLDKGAYPDVMEPIQA